MLTPAFANSPFRHFALSPIRGFADSPIRHFAHSPFRHFANSPFRHFAMSPIRHFAISPIRHFAISPFRHFADSQFRKFAFSLLAFYFANLHLSLIPGFAYSHFCSFVLSLANWEVGHTQLVTSQLLYVRFQTDNVSTNVRLGRFGFNMISTCVFKRTQIGCRVRSM